MILRMSLMVSLAMLTASNATADLIFSLGPVQFGTPGFSDAFIDLSVRSNGSDEFAAFVYSVRIDPENPATSNDLFFDTPVLDELTNNFVFQDDPGDLAVTPLSLGLIQGIGLTGTETNIPLENGDGQRLVGRIELGFGPGLSAGDTFAISLDPSLFSVEDENSMPVNFTAVGTTNFTFGNTAAVPEPASVAALTLLVGGIMYRRRKKQV